MRKPYDSNTKLESFWPHIDANGGNWVVSCSNVWNAKNLSDGCLVEFNVTCGNACAVIYSEIRRILDCERRNVSTVNIHDTVQSKMDFPS